MEIMWIRKVPWLYIDRIAKQLYCFINKQQYCFKHFVSFRQYGVTRVDKDEKVNILVVTNYDGSSIFNFTGLIWEDNIPLYL